MIRLLLCTLLFFRAILSAEIIEIHDLNESKVFLKEVDSESLIIFDIDETLLFYEDIALRAPRKEIRKLLNSSLNKEELWGIILHDSKRIVVDPKNIFFVRELQEKGYKLIACTALPSGKLGKIASLEKWRQEDLLELGFDFSLSFVSSCYSFPDKRPFSLPLYTKGILFAAGRKKGPVLKKLFEALEWKPKKIFFFDDERKHLHSVERMSEELGIAFMGFEYRASDAFTAKIDEKVFHFQRRDLVERKRWISDSKVKQRLKENSV